MTPAQWCTVADAKRYIILGKNITSDVALLETLIQGATAAMTSSLGRTILLAEVTEIRDGTGTGTLVLAQYPVVSVSSVAVGPPTTTRTPLVVDVDYVVTATALKRLAGSFTRGVANVAITYTAGYATIPADLRDACAKWSALKYRQLERIGQSSKSLAGETVTFDTDAMPKDVALTLENYRRRIQVGTVR